MTRSEHLAWAKARALEYLDSGDAVSASSSLLSDLDKHDETRGHIGISLGAALMRAGQMTDAELRHWITGFN